ncbi:polyamine ABC transporter periplasmic polyamine-binding protein [Salinisphaera sp. PC39]|uniref:extracellular solute-binding protein n=1 Tax=Salinisphaera sp. PC39 TaxID=1304156 RepID=UPI003342402F
MGKRIRIQRLRRSALVLAAPLVAALLQPAAAADLNVVSWGGVYMKSQILGAVRPFEDTTGKSVEVLSYNGGLEEVRAQVYSYNVKWDVIDIELGDALRGCEEGLFVEVDHDDLPPSPDGVPAREDFLPGTLTECAVGSVIWTTVLGYRAGSFGDDPPDSVEDFFDIDQYPGHRGMRRTPKRNLEWALIADGVPADKVYEVLATPAGQDRAFETLSRIKPLLVWWDTGIESIRNLRNGDVRLSTVWSGRAWEADTHRGAELELIWNHQIWSVDLWAVLKHGRRQDLAMDFLRFATSTETLARQTQYIPYGPARRSAEALVPEAMLAYLPTAESHMAAGALEFDAEFWSRHFDRINHRFQRWLERPVRVPEYLPR